MKTWSSILPALFVAVFAMGSTAMSVRAGGMAVEMAMAGSMDDSSSGDCNGCNGGADKDFCFLMCATQAAALSPSAQPLTITQNFGAVFTMCRSLRGRTALPDPGPPRTIDIG